MDSLGFVVIASAVFLHALVSKRLGASILTPPMAFTVFGLLIGDAILGLTSLDFGHDFIHGLAEVTLILVLFSDAARIDLRTLRRDHDLPLRMLLIGMPGTIALGTLAALLLPLGLEFWEAALLAAILAPTDAALGQAVVSNPVVPVRIRQSLNVESGLNDGVALPFVLIFASLTGAGLAAGEQDWFLFGALQVSLGPLAGVAVGGGGAWLIDAAARRRWTMETYEGGAILALAFLAFAVAEIIGGNGFIAAFVAGLTFGTAVRQRCAFIFEFTEAEGQLLVLVTFLIFGAAILPVVVDSLTWPVFAYAALSLSVVRLLPVALSLVGTGVRLPTVLFLGWFGPRGLASLLFALFVLENIPNDVSEPILTVTVVTVALSILLHGVSAAPLARLYGGYARRHDEAVELRSVSELRTRHGAVEQWRES